MDTISLNGIWSLYRQEDFNPIPARVPGTVLNDLMENNLLEDPFYRDNEKIARQLSFQDYCYEREFEISSEFLGMEKIELCCEGLDTLTNIYINDRLLARTDNMFRLYELDVKRLLKDGTNKIRIEFLSSSRFAQEMQENKELFQFDYSMPGIGYIRKGHYMFGWDWGPQIPDAGIYRSISLKAYREGKIKDVVFEQKHEAKKVTLDIKAEAVFRKPDTCWKATVTAPDGTVLCYKGEEGSCRFDIEDPLLWWPNGHGEQYLYHVDISICGSMGEADHRHYQIGLRKIELIQEEDAWGTSFCFRINDVPIYMKGADYIPEDNILARCSYDRTRQLLLDCITCNHNAIRVWGGGIYPEEYFYDLCDELGIVVWQDLMFACATYNSDDPVFLDTTLEEIRYNIGRIRHRACLGLVCGNNEMELAHAEWEMKDREDNKRKYLDLFECRLPALAKEVAPDVIYWLASPTSGGNFINPNEESKGDMHYWGVWHMMKPFVAYRTVNPRFMSEFGIQSFPCLKTMKTCTLPEDRNIFSRIMEQHQKSGSEGNGRILHYISQLYRYPKDFESLLYISQNIQAEGIRFGVEYWRRIYGRCMGVVYWQLNDCWPVASWSGIDSCGRWKALHYFSKNFFAPVLLSVNDHDRQLDVFVTNDLNREAKLELSWGLYSFDGSKRKGNEVEVTVGSCQAVEVLKLDFRPDIPTEEEERTHLVFFELKENGKVISENKVYFTPVKYMELKKPHIQAEVEEKDGLFVFTFCADVLVKALFVDFKDYDFVLSDNFFDLIPGIEKKVSMPIEKTCGLTPAECREQIKWMSVVDTYDY